MLQSQLHLYQKNRRQIYTSASLVLLFAIGVRLFACVSESTVGCDACKCEDIIKSSPSHGVDAAAAGRGVAVPWPDAGHCQTRNVFHVRLGLSC